jgi:arylsulfatase A-like enzyme
VPTMVTGLSFLDHQITGHGQSLSDQATTLAEYLKTRDYRTAAFSATPNNSRALGTDQGYDDFVESWKVVARKDSIDPFLLSGLAVRWLAEHGDESPLHLQLHFVPPHAPYKPAPDFDLFTDPDYQGRCDGRNETLAALDSSKFLPTPKDLAHVIALYDGNLRAADAAVSQVLQALRRRRRWKNTVVLIVSDHGEAFLEHGRMGHNSTAFDEMLRVPFILRLPRPVDSTAPNLDGLVTLADIVPTLLSTAGIEAEPGLAGVNLLGSAVPGSPPPRSGFVIRTTGRPPLYAFRTAQWKLMLSGSGLGALFDLADDPKERRDLSLENRAVFAGLGRSLTRRLAVQPRFEPVINPDKLPDQDVEMLKALGYVQ